MENALTAAEAAKTAGEVPVGACLVDANGRLVAAAGNRTISTCDPTAHAEIIVLREAARETGNYRLTDTTVYTTIEPCAMCAGALVNARVSRLVYGARDKRFGAVESVFRLCDSPLLNHRIEIVSGVLAERCGDLMSSFFRAKRGGDRKSADDG